MLLCASLLLLLLRIPSTSSAVVGIDFGSELFKIGIATPGRPFEIVLDLQSLRKTPAVASFVEATREFGESGLAHASKEPSDVLLLTPTLLALNISSPSNPLERIVNPFFPIVAVPNEERGTIGILLKRRNMSLAPEEVVANLFEFIERIVANFQGNPGKSATLDAVITIPSLFNMRQRQAILDAANIAGINVLGLVRETSAAALHHGRDLPANFTGTKLFVNVGAWRTQACVVRYNITSTTKPARRKSWTNVIHCDESDDVGGRHVDLLLSNYMAKKAGEKFSIKDLPGRALQRILSQAQKTKMVLSANKKADFFVEGLYDDKSFHAPVTRDELEELVEPVLPLIGNLINRVLEQSNVKKENLNGVELIGGGWRMPRIQEEIKKFIKPHDLGQHVNGDEGAALGATLVAANASLAFKIKDTFFSDSSDFGYKLRLRNVTDEWNGKEWRSKDLVKIGGMFGESRKLSTTGCFDLFAELSEISADGKSTLLTTFDITGIKDSCEGKYKELGTPKVNLLFSTSLSGIVTLDSVFAQWEEKYMAPVPEPKTTTTTTTTTMAAEKKSEEGETTTTTTTATTSTTTVEPKMVEQIRKRTVKCKVVSTETGPRPMNPNEISEAKKRLTEFKSFDLSVLKLAKARNELESFVYSTRSELETEKVMKVSLETERADMSARLLETEEWLYDEGAAAAIDVLRDRLHKLQKDARPILEKAFELEGRAEAQRVVEATNDKIQKALSREVLEKMEMNATRLEKFEEQWNKFNDWFDKKKAEQEKKSLTDYPAYTVSEVQDRLTDLGASLVTLIRSSKMKEQLKKNETQTAEKPSDEVKTEEATTKETEEKEKEELSTSTTTQAPQEPREEL